VAASVALLETAINAFAINFSDRFPTAETY
jgi:hypothetical protein